MTLRTTGSAIFGRRDPVPALLAGAMVGTLAVTATALAGYPRSVVRNDLPQRSASTFRDEHPIYYPRPGTAPSTAEPSDRLLREFLDRHTAMDYEASAALAEQLVELAPGAAAHYNHACAMGRLHRSEEALVSLQYAVDCGWRDLVHMSLDPDLDALRGDPRYGKLVRTLIRLLTLEQQTAEHRAGGQVPTPLIDFDGAAATVALVDDGQITWTGQVGDGDRKTLPGPDDRIEIGADMLSVIAMAQLNAPRTQRADRTGAPTLILAANPPRPPSAPTPIDGAAMIEAVESASGMTFADYCQRHILDPFGMTGTRFVGPPIVESTARDLARLLASFSGWNVRLELRYHGPDHQVVMRWDPERGRGVVVVSSGDGTARRIARLALGGALAGP